MDYPIFASGMIKKVRISRFATNINIPIAIYKMILLAFLSLSSSQAEVNTRNHAYSIIITTTIPTKLFSQFIRVTTIHALPSIYAG